MLNIDMRAVDDREVIEVTGFGEADLGPTRKRAVMALDMSVFLARFCGFKAATVAHIWGAFRDRDEVEALASLRQCTPMRVQVADGSFFTNRAAPEALLLPLSEPIGQPHVMVPLVQGHALAAYVPRLGFENAVEALVLFAGEAAASWIDFADVTDHVHPGSPRLFAQTREWLGRVHEVASAVVTVGHDGESAEVVSDREDAMQRVREAVDCVERVITEIRETGNSSSLGSLLGAERSRDWLLALVG